MRLRYSELVGEARFGICCGRWIWKVRRVYSRVEAASLVMWIKKKQFDASRFVTCLKEHVVGRVCF